MDVWREITGSGWYPAGAMVLGMGLWLAAWAAERRRAQRLRGQVGRTWEARLGQPLPAPITLLASLGEARGPRVSADALVMTVTPGVRLISVGLTAVFLWLIWQSPGAGETGPMGEMVPGGPWVKAGLTALVVLGVLHQFLFEARVDRDRLVTETLLVWRREYAWRDLQGIADSGAYEYRLDFGARRMRLPKYLVGMPGLLNFLGEVLARNFDARTARG